MILRKFKTTTAFMLTLALVFSFLTTAGCSRRADTRVGGWIYAGEAVSGAAFSVLDTSGKKISKAPELMAAEQGVILIETNRELPDHFRILAEGGTLNGEAFAAKLCADIRDYNAESDTIYINLATTIVAAYLDRNPESSLSEASAAIKKFLEIPDSFDLPSETQLSGVYFNNAQFLEEAQANGGVNPFIEILLTQMEAGETHPFREALPLQGGAASWLATTLAEGAVSYVGGELMGWGLDKAGIGFGEEDHTAEELAKIQEGMAEMKAQMAEMSFRLDAIEKTLNNILLQLKDMLKQITHQQALSDYGNRVLQMNDLISSIHSIRRDLNDFIINPPEDPEDARLRLINRIESKIIDRADVIHNQLVGLAGEKPLITLWREIVYEDRYLDWHDYNKVKSQYDFFRNYQDAILLLQVEYYHAIEKKTGANAAIIMDCIETYKEHLEQQEALLSLPIEENVVIDTKWNGMYYSPSIEFGSSEGFYKLAGKSKKTVMDDMAGIVSENVAGFSDWEALDYDSLGALIYNHILDRGTNNWSEFMVQQGWPGVKVEGGTIIPFFNLDKLTKFAYYQNEGPHFKTLKSFPEAGFANTGNAYSIVMAYRQITAKDYGYEHLRQ